VRRVLARLVLVALPLTLGACGDAVDTVREGVQDAATLVQFCSAAVEVAQAVDDRDWDRAIERGEVMVAEAPDEIRPDAQTVLDGAKRIRDGDAAAAQDQEFQAAAERVRDYSRDRCDPTN
jgi:hypothetical protein